MITSLPYESTILHQLISLIGESLFFFLLLTHSENENWIKLIIKSLPKTLKSNIVFYTLDLILVSSILVIIHSYLAPFFENYSLSLLSTLVNGTNLFSILILLLAIIVGDFIGYWRHRLEHSKLLWPFHLAHHSDNDMTWFTIYRFHPINRLTTSLIDIGILKIIGFPLWAIGLNIIIRHYYGMFCHSKVDLDYKKWGCIFISPNAHQWHHVHKGKGINSNFATIFSIWDILFKTYYLPGKCNEAFGVDGIDGDKLFIQYFYPLLILKNKLTKYCRIISK